MAGNREQEQGAGAVGPEQQVTPECPGRYELRGLQGRGGQARVYLARDRHLDREVAWKELAPERQVGPRSADSNSMTSLDRFLREARVTGRLEHPSIVPVYELGRRDGGAFYYTMKLVRGRTLSEALQGQPLDGRLRLLPHFRDVCQALAFAHSRRVIHRDVKPANVMVGEFGETVLLDWGLAKERGAAEARGGELDARQLSLGDDSGETVDGAAVGTPAYMSPEQAEGRLRDVDERSDVWGLGALLYELLTGKPPFAGATPTATLYAVSHQALLPVRAHCPEAPAELAAIAEKALRKPREDRYQAAGELAAEVTAYMSGLRVAAYAYSSWQLLRRFAARNRVLIGAAVLVFAATVAALAVTSLAWREESAARASEQAARRDARYGLAQAYAREAERLTDGRYGLAARLYAAASLDQNPAHPASRDPDPAFEARTPDAGWLRIDALSLLLQTRQHRVQGLVKSLVLDESVFRVAFSPDGKLLAAVDYGGSLLVWSTADFSERLRVKTGGRLMALAFTPDSAQVAAAGEEKVVRLWDLATGRQAAVLGPVAANLHALAVDPAGRRLAAGDQDGRLLLWDLPSGRLTRLEPGHREQVREVAFSPDGRALVTSSWDKTARIWDLDARSVRATLEGHTDGVYGAAISPDGRRVATAAYDRTLRLWNLATGRPLATLDNQGEAYGVAFSPDSALLASVDNAGALRLFDARTLQTEAAVRAHGNAGAVALAFHPGGRLLVTAGLDRLVRVWALAAEGSAPRILHPDWVYGLAWTPDGRLIASGCWDRAVRLWDARTHALVRKLDGHEAGVTNLALTRDGRLLASAGYDGDVRVWEVASGRAGPVLRGGQGVIRAVAFSPDARLVAAATAGSTALVWDLATGARIASLASHGGSLFGIAFSPDGRTLATAAGDYAVRLFDTATWALVRTLQGHTDWATGLAWSPDGRLLASSGKDAAVLLWDPATGALLSTLRGHASWVSSLDFSADGRLLASGGEDERVVVWDVAARKPVLRLRTARDSARAIFSPDGQELVIADHQAAVRYKLDLPWTVDDPRALLDAAQAAAGLRLEGFAATIARTRP